MILKLSCAHFEKSRGSKEKKMPPGSHCKYIIVFNIGFVHLLVLSLCGVVVAAVQITNAETDAEEHHYQDLEEDWFHNQFAIGKAPVPNFSF